jgi:fucose 4-O-acetylase-like acetyltransferase
LDSTHGVPDEPLSSSVTGWSVGNHFWGMTGHQNMAKRKMKAVLLVPFVLFTTALAGCNYLLIHDPYSVLRVCDITLLGHLTQEVTSFFWR